MHFPHPSLYIRLITSIWQCVSKNDSCDKNGERNRYQAISGTSLIKRKKNTRINDRRGLIKLKIYQTKLWREVCLASSALWKIESTLITFSKVIYPHCHTSETGVLLLMNKKLLFCHFLEGNEVYNKMEKFIIKRSTKWRQNRQPWLSYKRNLIRFVLESEKKNGKVEKCVSP